MVGCGPAGASAAAAAARTGCAVLLLDKRRSAGTPVQCAEFVSAALSLDAVPWAAVTSQPIERMVTLVEGREPRITENFRGRMISRARFDRALADDAVAHGARCLTDTAVVSIDDDGGVRLSNGAEVRPRVLIGADGPQSRVGAAVGRRNTELVAARQLTVPLTDPHDATDIFLRACYPGGYGWLFPKGPFANLGIGVEHRRRDRLKPLLDALRAELTAAGRLAPGSATSLTGGLIPVGGRLPVCARLREVPVLLAGDAAGLTNPVTGAGIESAVRSGTLAGIAAAGWLAGAAAALDDYEEELSSLYDASFARALRWRRALEGAEPGEELLRRAWISSPEYWSDRAA